MSAEIVVGCLLFALPKQPVGRIVWRPITECFCAFARRRTLAIAVLVLAVLAIRISLLHFLTVPAPGIHDEFSYLLMSDTFAHGRLSNPTHPLWRSFETFHVNWLPTYSSIYPPAQGIALAAGQLMGHPWIGVLLSNAIMCGAILWMLQGWLPPRWALLGAVLAAMKLALTSYWMNSYWGGAVGAIGGALVLGALPRIRKSPRLRSALALAVGVAILANSRPYEGMLLCLPVCAWLVWWFARGGLSKASGPSQFSRAIMFRRVIAPIAIVLTLTSCAMAFYNWRLTGNALLFPYALNLRTYVTAPIFLWQHAKPALRYNNAPFEDFYNGWERTDYRNTWDSVREVSLLKWTRLRSVFFWPAVLLLLPSFLFVFRDERIRFPLLVLLVTAPGLFLIVWSNPHYAAPLTCIVFLLLVQSMRHLGAWRPYSRPLGAAVLTAIILLLVVQTIGAVKDRKCDVLTWTCGGDSSRSAIVQRLTSLPGKHLILVRYEPDHNIHDEWVFNGAEIDGAKILWARELDAAQNAALIAYFHDRQIWLVNPDVDNLELLPYSEASANSHP